MAIKLLANLRNPPISGLAAIILVTNDSSTEVKWGNETSLQFPDGKKLYCHSNNDVLRALARLGSQTGLYGESAVEKTLIDHWLTFSLTCEIDISWAMSYLEKSIAPVTYLVANKLTIADFAVFNEIYLHYDTIAKNGLPRHVERWYNLIKSQYSIQKALTSMPANVQNMKRSPSNEQEVKSGQRKQEGKFIDLPGAVMGEVVVRFPPEASGYLHIGHAKAALLNQYYQQAFKGKLIMRFDDTNPAKENLEFEKVILEDLEMLEIKPDIYTKTSQYFDIMLGYCETLIKEGKAYVDDTDPETMKKEREQKVESANRVNSAAKNMEMWKEMVNGTEKGQKCCVRAKIDMSSPNGCLRDPTIYRCKNEPHPETGTKYKVYPTYDFACPIVDAIENVTHTLRTMEYHDRDEQFYWFIDALKLRKPIIWEYSRLNMTNTVLSKRKLTWFVEEGLVDGWDDPRFPTVRGILRRGMTVEGLREFIIAQGSSKSVVFMNWDKIWAFNKKVIDPIAPRYTALEKDNQVVVNVAGVKKEAMEVAAHPKNDSVGKKTVWIGPRILIDYVDAESLIEGENATFINWGNLMVKKIHKTNGKITSIDASPNLENKDFRKTLKLTWLCDLENSEYPPTYFVYFDHIINKPVLAKDEDFKKYIGHSTRQEVEMLGDPELKKCKKGDIIQIQRRGFFKVDNAYSFPSLQTTAPSPVILFSIPDGHTKDVPSSGIKKPIEETAVKPASNKDTGDALKEQIVTQGNIVRDLKTKKALKEEIEKGVKLLLSLKAEYKNVTGKDFTPTVETTSSDTLNSVDLNEQIKTQGNIVRDLKSKKASKDEVEQEVKILLKLKAEYKKATGKDWTPTADNKQTTANTPNALSVESSANDLSNKITSQGNIIRDLKSKKASKEDIEIQVKILLSLKADYKKEIGKDWTPNTDSKQSVAVLKTKAVPSSESTNGNINELSNKIEAQGNIVRDLKSKKASKDEISKAVSVLLSLKADYKKASGKDWTPTTGGNQAKKAEQTTSTTTNTSTLNDKIKEQGNIVRDLKAKKAAKDELDREVKVLLSLKSDYKNATGSDWDPNQECLKENLNRNNRKSSSAESASTKVSKKENKKSITKKDKIEPEKEGSGIKKQTRLGLEFSKEDNLPEWYSQVLTKGELIEYYDVSGCYILRHWSYAIWKTIKNWFDAEITKLGVKECYFPIFVSKAALEREKTHIADFAPEVAWVTKSGESDLAEPIAVRPTSETVMYPAYAKWVQSYRDLPIRLNQWNNVVRWEFKHPQPFLRTREFLWQEGHSAFASKSEADDEVLTILNLYAQIYTHLLAIPVVKGRKTEKEKFAGGDYTTTVEAFIAASGRAIQGATSHHLGQNFSKMFEIVYEDPESQKKQYVYQNSWGITTRTIGVMIMIHADNQGLVLPPHVATIQVIIVPCGITASMKIEDKDRLLDCCQNLEKQLIANSIRAEGDYRDNYSPGWKFNHWELKGVPIRIEIGPKDMQANQLVAVRRDTGEKLILSQTNIEKKIAELLETIHLSMLDKATKDLHSHTKTTKSWDSFCKFLDAKNVILAPFCGEITCEDKIKADSVRGEDADPGVPSMGAKSLCIPFEHSVKIENCDKCIHPDCGNKPKFYTLFGRSY